MNWSIYWFIYKYDTSINDEYDNNSNQNVREIREPKKKKNNNKKSNEIR